MRNSSQRLTSASVRRAGEYNTTRRMGGPRQPAGSGKSSHVRRTKMPVVRIDEAPVGDGRPGPVTRRLQDAFRRAVRAWLAAV